jgi:hypothetical protein
VLEVIMTTIRITFCTIVLILGSCKGEHIVVPAPSRPSNAPTPAETPPAVEAQMVANCSPKSHFGTQGASEMLKFPMRWVNPGTADCKMVPPGDTDPFFAVSVVDYAQRFDDFVKEDPDAERDRDAVNRAQRVAWSSKKFTLHAADSTRLVIVTMGSPNKPPRSANDARLQATVIASKLLAYF